MNRNTVDQQARDLLERIGVADAKTFSSGDLVELANLIDGKESLRQQLAAAQAKIDELMLEHCPDEMTPEQIAEWAKHQEVVVVPKTVKMECFLVAGELLWRDENQSVLRHWKRFPAGDLEGEVVPP